MFLHLFNEFVDRRYLKIFEQEEGGTEDLGKREKMMKGDLEELERNWGQGHKLAFKLLSPE